MRDEAQGARSARTIHINAIGEERAPRNAAISSQKQFLQAP